MNEAVLNIPSRKGGLGSFNHLVLCYQDQAFTLASHFLADDRLAESVVRNAIEVFYREQSWQAETFRLELLCRVAGRLLSYTPKSAANSPTGSGVSARLARLSPTCRLVAILVDCLGLSYAETARVSRLDGEQVRCCLTQARLGLLL